MCFVAFTLFSNNCAVAEEVITKKDYSWYQLETVDNAVEYCERFLKENPEGTCSKNEQVQVEYYPNDPMYVFGLQWSLDKTNTLKAWELTRGRNVTVAVIDTGVDYTHQDLSSNIAINTEGNIFGCPGDDTYGCRIDHDARTGENNDPVDLTGHGTHVAGIIAATGNNDLGVVGVAPETKILPIKIVSDYATVYDLGLAIDYAIARHVDVINISLSFSSYSDYIESRIREATEYGIVVVVAAGNYRKNLNNASLPDTSYPCQFENVICVSSSNQDDVMSIFSNHGNQFVHLFAPGNSILSTIPHNYYYYMSGTSMATPEVSATAALLKSLFNFSPEQIRDIITHNIDVVNELSSSISGGRLNVASSVFQSNVERKKTLKYATFDITRNAKLIRAKLYRTFDLMPIVRQTVYLQCAGDYAYRKKLRTNKTGIVKMIPTAKSQRKIKCWLKTSFVKYGLTKEIRSDTFRK